MERSLEDLVGDGPELIKLIRRAAYPAPKRKRAGRKPAEGGRAPTPTRDRLNAAQADLAEIRARKMANELVPAADVQAEWTAIILDLRAAMLAVPDRVGARLGDLTPAHLEVISGEIRAALSALAAQDGPA